MDISMPKKKFYSSLTNPSTRFVNNVIYAGVALVGAFMIPGGALTEKPPEGSMG